jgi:hypothetical protein
MTEQSGALLISPPEGQDALMVPTVHMNGTSHAGLITMYEDAAESVSEAITTHALSYPNGRDYYPQGTDAYLKAVKQYNDRRKKLQDVYDELTTILRQLHGVAD